MIQVAYNSFSSESYTSMFFFLSLDLIGTKESAYVHALTSAGIAYAITKACSAGWITTCGCDMTIKDKSINESIRWNGCSDNVLFATELTRKFVNLREYKTKTRTSLLNIHNNQFGIQVRYCSIYFL